MRYRFLKLSKGRATKLWYVVFVYFKFTDLLWSRLQPKCFCCYIVVFFGVLLGYTQKIVLKWFLVWEIFAFKASVASKKGQATKHWYVVFIYFKYTDLLCGSLQRKCFCYYIAVFLSVLLGYKQKIVLISFLVWEIFAFKAGVASKTSLSLCCLLFHSILQSRIFSAVNSMTLALVTIRLDSAMS